MSEAPTICLNMIVRDEAASIERCLASVRPFITHWTIVDTGSTDGTQDVIRRALADVPGELFERPWVDFGHNRTEAIRLAGTRAEWVLLMDADDVLVTAPGFVLPTLTADAYTFRIENAGLSWERPHLVRSALPWRFVGVLHEYLDCDAPHSTLPLDGVTYRGSNDGARSRDPLKFAKDAEVLERALAADPTNARHAFYLAQSYKDAGLLDLAIDAYEARARMPGWAEETFYARYEVARLHERLHPRWRTVRAAYLDAWESRPTRAEPLCELARYCRGRGEWHQAYAFASIAAGLSRPDDRLFVDDACYRWRALDEFAIAAHWTGRYAEAVELGERLLCAAPTGELVRVAGNLRHSVEAVGR